MAHWLLNPSPRLTAVAVYDLLGSDSPTERGLYLNLGYWREATSFDAASEALVHLVGAAAHIGPKDRVLDCGFGFGDQDLLWARTRRPAQIVGLNLTRSQVTLARRRVAAAGLGERVDLRHGSATAMPSGLGPFDCVVALECAFHFLTRERFFHEVWRVLRPGGRLVLADIIPTPVPSSPIERRQHRLSWGAVASKFAIPAENADTAPDYHRKLARSGFAEIRLTSIRDDVYPPLQRYWRTHPAALRRLHPLLGLAARIALRFDTAAVSRGLDYVLVTARKPA
jgi:cyclopropane fatty-acyl-phospholipid synthase-like methyltransferase